jgi:HK97 gp10 family phage protein
MGKITRISRFKFLEGATPAIMQAALMKTGADVLAVSQQLVPVDTSSLKKSGGVVPVTSTLIHVGYGGPGKYYANREPAKYAAYVEYGTSQHGPQPFLRPAFTQARETMEKHVKDEIEKLT